MKRKRILITPLALTGLYVLIMILLPAAPVSALTKAQKKVIDSGIYDFNTEDDSTTSCTASGTSLSGKENKEKSWNYLIGKGLTPVQAAGVMGNIQAESHFEPRLVQYGKPNSRGEISVQGQPSSLDDNVPVNGESGYGLAQWTSKGRQQNLVNFAKDKNQHVYDLGLQLDFIYFEATEGSLRGAWDSLKQQTTVQDATLNWHKLYESSADSAQKLQGRVTLATGILAEFGSTVPSASTPNATATTSSSCSGSTASASAIVQTALLYSWPEKGHGLTPKPEYSAALAQYNPKAPYGGADCGSFVAIVMHATGADPNYPLVGTSNQAAYVRSHPEKYDVVDSVGDLSELQPGDIMIVAVGTPSNPGIGHTYIYVGKQPPKNLDEASASGGDRMPNLGHAETVDSLGRGNYMRARLKT